jgi:hypothetical protein
MVLDNHDTNGIPQPLLSNTISVTLSNYNRHSIIPQPLLANTITPLLSNTITVFHMVLDNHDKIHTHTHTHTLTHIHKYTNTYMSTYTHIHIYTHTHTHTHHNRYSRWCWILTIRVVLSPNISVTLEHHNLFSDGAG